MRTRFSLFALGLAVLFALTGCNSDRRAPVSGKITVSGKGPLPGGNIRFVSVADPNRVGGALIKPDGTYEVPDAPLGECKVVVDNTHLDPNANKGTAPGTPGTGGMPGAGPGMPGMKGAPAPPSIGGSGPKAADKAKMNSAAKGAEVTSEMSQGKADLSGQKYVKLEAGYAKAETTTLKADIKSGANTYDFDVK